MKKTSVQPPRAAQQPESEARFSHIAPSAGQGLSAEHLLAIFESVPGLYLILTPDAPTFTIVAVSDAYAQATMTTREHILGKGLFEVFPDNPADPNATGVTNLTASLLRVVQSKQPHKMALQQYDIRKPKQEGGAFEVRYWSPLNSPVLDTAGEVAYLVHSVVDVTDVLQSEQRKEAAEQKATDLQLLYSELLLAQHKVQESEAYFRALTTATSDVIYRMSADWAQMRALDGRKFLADTGEPIDNWLEKYIYLQDQQQVMQVIQEAIQTKSIFQLEHQVKRADGTAGWTFSRAIPILDQQGELVEWFGAASDITEHKKAKELEYQYRSAEEANRVRSQFLSTMSHELRTPLAAIIGFSQLLLDDAAAQQLSEQQHVNLQRILKNGQHLLGLVSDVLDLEKIDAGRMEITYEPVDVRELLTSVVEETQAMAIERHLLLRAEVEEGLDLLESNAVKLRQILLNLVSNALKYSDQGEVLVSARRPATGEEPDAVVLAVKDTGIGIPPEAQARIFEAFYQVEGGYTRKVGGTGLGLAITSRLTTLLGGTIELESAPGQGSTFTVTLPTKAAPLSEAKQIPRLHPVQETSAVRPAASSNERAVGVAQLEAAPGQPPLVLAVDDNPDVIVLLKDALKDSPYTVMGVQDPTRVMALVQQMRPSAITLDVLMDDTNGWQILDQLKRNPATASIPVVMLTVISESNTGYVLGADDYLLKPFKKETLLRTLQKVMVSQKERSEARECVAHTGSTRSPSHSPERSSSCDKESDEHTKPSHTAPARPGGG